MLLVLQESDESVHHEAYNTLNKILEVWICFDDNSVSFSPL